jgi:hypothetical protein
VAETTETRTVTKTPEKQGIAEAIEYIMKRYNMTRESATMLTVWSLTEEGKAFAKGAKLKSPSAKRQNPKTQNHQGKDGRRQNGKRGNQTHDMTSQNRSGDRRPNQRPDQKSNQRPDQRPSQRANQKPNQRPKRRPTSEPSLLGPVPAEPLNVSLNWIK